MRNKVDKTFILSKTRTVGIKKLPDLRDLKDGYIDLNKVKDHKEDSILLGTNAKCWFSFENGRVLFKKYDDQAEAFGEVLYSIIAKNHKINCAKYDFAKLGEGDSLEKGTISYDLSFNKMGENKNIVMDGIAFASRYMDDKLHDFIKTNKMDLNMVRLLNRKYNNYASFVEFFKNRFKDDNDDPNKENDTVKRLKKEIIKIFTLDVLLDNMDKNLWNFMLVTDKLGKNPSIYSIDSSCVALLYRGSDYVKGLYKKIKSSDNIDLLDEYLLGGSLGYDSGVKESGYNPYLDLCDFYRKSLPNERKELFSLINEINIDKEIAMTTKYVKVDKEIANWVKLVFNYRKEKLLLRFIHIDDNYNEVDSKKNLRFKDKGRKNR